MFGYIRIDKPELKVREYEAYRGAYCGLCRAMGKCTGCASRMMLSYDVAFLLVFRLVLTETPPVYEQRRCIVHPFLKRPMLKYNGESGYAACAAALLSYYKCKDDLLDEHGKSKLRARLLMPHVAGMRRRALRKRPELKQLDETIGETMEKLRAAETEGTPSVDRYAALSGELLEAVFSFGLSDTNARIARTVGKHVGKWIYLVDAFDDLQEDGKEHRFNPYLLLWDIEANADVWAERREMIRVALLSELMEVENGMDLVDFSAYPDFFGVIRNIMYRGMPHTADAVLCGKTKRDRKNEADREKGIK